MAMNAIDPRDLLEHSPCGYVVIDLDGHLLFANSAFLRLAGRTGGALCQTRFQDLLLPGATIFYETQFYPSLLLRGFLNEISFDLLDPAGKRVPIFVNAALRKNKSDQRPHILMAIFEAKQRRLYENELLRARKESEQISEVVRRSSDAVIRLTSEGSIQSWNTGAEQIFGISSAEAIGRPLVSLFAEEARSEIGISISELKRGVEIKKETIGLHKGGETKEVSINMTPHWEAPGILVAFSAIIRDITSRKRAEKALLQNEKLASVGRLASSIAHEINNPLESVTNLLYILAGRDLGPEAGALVKIAQEELARVSQITTHTLRFHKQSSHRTELDLATLSDSVLGLYRARLQNSGITAINDSSAVSPLLCYEGELRQILVNLVGNAFDAMRTGGRLILRNRDTILWRTGTKGVRITVADTGTGMDHASLERIFEPFFSTKGIGGTGLGLWIAQGLVTKNAGYMKVRSSTRPGKSGTVFTMFFPHKPSSE